MGTGILSGARVRLPPATRPRRAHPRMTNTLVGTLALSLLTDRQKRGCDCPLRPRTRSSPGGDALDGPGDVCVRPGITGRGPVTGDVADRVPQAGTGHRKDLQLTGRAAGGGDALNRARDFGDSPGITGRGPVTGGVADRVPQAGTGHR